MEIGDGLSGQRVRLVPLELAQVAALLEAASEDRDTYDLTRVPANFADMTAYVQDALAEQAAGTSIPFAVLDAATARVIGSTRFLDLEFWPLPGEPGPRATPSAAEIGSTWLAPSAQRSPVNTEMKLLLLTYAFEAWRVCRMTLKTDARNARSRAAIERIGASYEGIRRAHTLGSDGTIRDTAYFSLLAAEWPTAKAALEARLRVD